MPEITIPSGIHKRLSHLLQDPVGADDANGALFTSEERNGFIQYGAQKLYRVLRLASKPELLYEIYRHSIDFQKGLQAKEVEKISPLENVIISVREASGNEVKKVDYDSRNLYSTQFSNTSYYYPHKDKLVLSEDAAKHDPLTVVSMRRSALFPESDYEDLVLTLGAERGWTTVGNAARAAAFSQSFSSEIQLIVGAKNEEKVAQ